MDPTDTDTDTDETWEREYPTAYIMPATDAGDHAYVEVNP